MKFRWAGRLLGVILALACASPVLAQTTATGTYSTFGLNDGGQKQAVAPVALISASGCAVGASGCALLTSSAGSAAAVSGSASSATTLSNFPVVLATTAPGTNSFTAQWTVAGGGNQATYQGSNDGVTWFALPCQTTSTAGFGFAPASVIAISTTTPVVCQTLGYAQVRIIISSYVSGTPAATVYFGQVVAPFGGDTVTGNVAAGVADSGNPVKVGGIYNVTIPSLTDTFRGDAQLDVNGNLRTMLVGVASSGTDGVSNNAVVYVARGGTTQASNGLLTVGPALFNGTTWDRARSIQGVTAAGVGTTAVAEAPNPAAGSAPGTPVVGQTVSSLAVKAGAGNLYGFNVIAGSTAGFVVVNNTTAAPTGGTSTTPLYCLPIAASAGLTWRSDIPIKGTVGFTLLFSTSCGTYTAPSPVATFMQGEAP